MELEDLIQQGRSLQNSLQQHRSEWGVTYRHLNQDAYEGWLMLTKRYINTQFPGDKSVLEFEELSEESATPKLFAKMLGILEALQVLPDVVKDSQGETQPVVTINNTQNQTQSQSVLIEMFVDALHEELSRKQIREVKEIAENTNLTHEEKKSSILNKIKDFGIDTLSNIVANVLTNPAIWNNF